MMTGKQLKNSILQWAIQGKLVPQDPNDEPASVLLEKIRAEKARLIKEGKIKKDKKESIIYRGLPCRQAGPPDGKAGEDNSYFEKFADGRVVCIDDEIPFEIPSTWEWCRLGGICSKFSTGPFGTMLHKSDYVDDGIPFVNPTNIKGQQIVTENICRVAQAKYEELRAYALSENDIVLARRGDLSKCAIVNAEHSGWLAGTGSFFLHILGISIDYFMILYTSPYAQDYLIGDSVGTTMNNLNQSLLSRMLIPIPPYSEQNRILEYYRFIMPLIERYTVAYSERKALDNILPIQVRKSILQEAIQGRLVPQDPNDEPASVLLQRIREEKTRLVKEGKLKKKDVVDSVIYKGDDNRYYEKIGKTVTEITEELPFIIPDNWTWSRLSGVVNIVMGQSPDGNDVLEANKVDNAYEFHQGKICFTEKYIAPSGKWCKDPSRIADIGSLLVCVRAPIGDVNITQRQIGIGRGLAAITGYNGIKSDFLFYWLLAHKKMLEDKGTGSTFKAITIEVLKELLIPLPPLAEQQRIVERVEALLSHL